MTDSLFSPSWYRVANLKPRLRSHAQIHRHVYRGQVWFVLQDHASGRFHRFTPAANVFIGLIDGNRSTDEVWHLTCELLGDDAPTQGEVIRLLTQLHAADVLLSGVPPDVAELAGRATKTTAQRRRSYWRNPLAVRFPLLDPDRFLVRTLPLLRPFFGYAGLILWLVVVGAALIQVGLHWPTLTENITDNVLAGENLLWLWLTFPVLKAFHEFGHAYATRLWGGEVHEMGIMLLVLMPIPYVDASSASAFREKHRRAIVGAAGMLVELFIASLAVLVWVNSEPGAVRAIAYNIMFIAGVSTILFNGNPLLRYDGYYILQDLIGIPNLGTRSNRYLGYLFQKYVFGISNAKTPVSAPGERPWFIFYSIASFTYRMFVLFFIALFIGSKFFVIGIVLAIWAIWVMVLFPAGKILLFLISDKRLWGKRPRALIASVLIASAAIAPFLLLPAPYYTVVDGVIWAPEESRIRADTDAVITEVLTVSGAQVLPGDPLFRCEDAVLSARVVVLEAQLQEVQTRFTAAQVLDQVQAAAIREELQHAERRLADARKREAALIIHSETQGIILLDSPVDLPGRFVKRGQTIAYVVGDTLPTARVLVSQASVDLVRNRSRAVEVRFADRINEPQTARVIREVPAASAQLPSAAFALEGGGDFAVRPDKDGTLTAVQPFFEFDVALPETSGIPRLGGRVYVRFDHGYEPIVYRSYRSLRRLFLRHFNV